jgi:hypothetical protein
MQVVPPLLRQSKVPKTAAVVSTKSSVTYGNVTRWCRYENRNAFRIETADSLKEKLKRVSQLVHKNCVTNTHTHKWM